MEKNDNQLPKKHEMVFDRSSGGDTQYVGVSVNYAEKNTLGFRKHLLGISSMGSRDTFDATEHYDYISYAHNVDGKTIRNLVAIIEVKTASKNAFARRGSRLIILLLQPLVASRDENDFIVLLRGDWKGSADVGNSGVKEYR